MNMSRSYGRGSSGIKRKRVPTDAVLHTSIHLPTGLISRQPVRGSLTMKPPDYPPVAVIGARYSRTMRWSTPFVDLALQMMSGSSSPAQQSTIFGPHLQTIQIYEVLSGSTAEAITRRIKTTVHERTGPLQSAKRLTQESGNHESPSARAERKIETANSVATR